MKNYKTEIKKDLAKNTVLYKMNEITNKLNITARTIRYYESEGLLGDVKRSIGYTRYFTNKDIVRLKEVLKLKKKGHKIAQIKELFEKKYAKNDDAEIQYKCAVDATLIEEEDIAKCLNLGIEINDIDLVINKVLVNYLDWRNIAEEELLNPFSMQLKKASTKPRISMPQTDHWLGNGRRSIIINTLNQTPMIDFNQSYVDAQWFNITEWIFFPIKLQSTVTFSESLAGFYYLEKRHLDVTESYVLQQEDLLLLLEKQLKQIASSVNGLLKQVTFHRNSEAEFSTKISSHIESLVLNKDRLAIEDLGPIYRHSLGSNGVFLLSALT